MGYLPIFLDVTGRRCLVVGGGEVAERRVSALLDADAAVTVISPAITASIRSLADSGALSLISRAYRRGDIHGFVIAFAATDDDHLHRELAAEARELGVMLNVADTPELCSFIAPAVVRRGALQIAISTSGASPALARKIRRRLEHQFGPEYAIALNILAAARDRIKKSVTDQNTRAARLRALAEKDFAELLRNGELKEIDRALKEHAGFGLDDLALSPRLIGLGSPK